MFHEKSFDTRSFDTRSWHFIIDVVVKSLKRVAAKMPNYLRKAAPNFLLRK